MSEPEFLLEFLVVPLDTPAQFGDVDQLVESDVLRKIGQPILGRGLGVARPFDQQPVFGLASQANAHARKARRQPLGRAFSPPDGLPGTLGERECQLFDGHQVGVFFPRLWQPAARLWSRARPPHHRARLDGGHVGQPQRSQLPPQIAVAAVIRIHQYDPARDVRCERRLDLLERNLRLCHEADHRWNAGLAPTFAIPGPLARHIQSIRHRQACVVIGHRQRHRHLAIALSAKLSAVLWGHSHRVLSLLGKAGVIDNPSLDRAVRFEAWKHNLAHLRQHLFVRPIRLADKVQQRLVLGRGPIRRRYCGDRLHALALARAHKPCAIIPQRPPACRVPDNTPYFVNVCPKSRLTLTNAMEIHRSLPASECESPQYDNQSALALRPDDSVRQARVRHLKAAQVG